MKISDKNEADFWPEKCWDLEWITNCCCCKALPEERFEHWSCLVYTEITSKLINLALISKVVEN